MPPAANRLTNAWLRWQFSDATNEMFFSAFVVVNTFGVVTLVVHHMLTKHMGCCQRQLEAATKGGDSDSGTDGEEFEFDEEMATALQVGLRNAAIAYATADPEAPPPMAREVAPQVKAAEYSPPTRPRSVAPDDRSMDAPLLPSTQHSPQAAAATRHTGRGTSYYTRANLHRTRRQGCCAKLQGACSELDNILRVTLGLPPAHRKRRPLAACGCDPASTAKAYRAAQRRASMGGGGADAGAPTQCVEVNRGEHCDVSGTQPAMGEGLLLVNRQLRTLSRAKADARRR